MKKSLFVPYVVMYMKAKQLRQSARSATHRQRSSRSRLAKRPGLLSTL